MRIARDAEQTGIWWLIKHSIRPETVKLLLDNGADPNEKFHNVTCWQNALRTAEYYGSQHLDDFHQLANVLGLLLSTDANPHATIEWTERAAAEKRAAANSG